MLARVSTVMKLSAVLVILCVAVIALGQYTAENCGPYAAATKSVLPGNDKRVITVVKIQKKDLKVPEMFEKSTLEADNTLEVATACAWWRFSQAAAKEGKKVLITGGFRALLRQEYMWKCYKCECCNNGMISAFPGKSIMGTGDALSVDGDLDWVGANASKFGFKRPTSQNPGLLIRSNQ